MVRPTSSKSHEQIRSSNWSSFRFPFFLKGNKGAKLKLQKEWDKCKGQIDGPVMRKMFQVYDRDRDGVLVKSEAMQFVADLIFVSGMENDILKEIPIFKDEKGFLTEFVEVVVCDLAGAAGRLEILLILFLFCYSCTI